MKTNEETPRGESALLAQISELQKQLDDCLEPIGKKPNKDDTRARVERMIAKHGSHKAWGDKIDALYAAYEPAMLDLIERFSSTMDIKAYIDLLNDSHRALIRSKMWRTWDSGMRDDSAYAFQVMMDFLINLRVIDEKKHLEREIRGI